MTRITEWFQHRRHFGASLLAAVLLVGSACKHEPGGPSVPALTYTNVSYGADPAQIMDVFLPAGRGSSTPVVVFIHGGGWSGGDKSILTATDVKKLTDRGYACVNINYRLASATVHDPLLSSDVTAVLDFVAAHATEYKVASGNFGLLGHSAGAHLALLAGYKYNPDQRIKVVGSLAGPTDLTDAAFLAIPGLRETVENYLGVTQAAQPARWIGASPVSVATATAPPTILLQGQQDVLVPYSLAQKLDARLAVLGVAHELHLYPAYNHDLGIATLGHLPDDVVNPILVWLDRYLK